MENAVIPTVPSILCPIDHSSSDPILHALQHFKTEGIKVLESMNEDTLNTMLIKSNDAYYNVSAGERALLTDNEYDILKEHILERFPKNMGVQDIGAPVQGKNKVTLPYNLPSMDKIKPDTGALTGWKQKYSGPYVLSCKLDGVSGMYVVGKGTEGTKSTKGTKGQGTVAKLYTRGNGTVGQDISHLIPYLNLPNEPGLVVRGEFIMKKAVFLAKYADHFANARNLVAGTINRLTVDEKIRDIDFVAYEVIAPVLKPSEQMAKLTETGFKTVQNMTMADVTNDSLSDTLVKLRKEYEYEIDGIIVCHDQVHSRTDGNPDYAFAFKMVLSDQMAEVKVLDVLWTASKDGYLKPRVQIEPVQLSGVRIEYATGFNGAFIETNRIGLGAVIQIIRSGDVIPHIRAVISPAEYPKMPTVAYTWNATHVDIMLEDKESDATVREKNITGFFRGVEVDGLSAGNVSRIVAAGFDTVPKILKMTKADFLTIDGFKDKLATKIHDGIRDKVAAANLTTLMAASNLFGRGFSDKRIALALEEYPDVLTSSESTVDKVKRLSETKGMAKKTAEAFVEAIPAFLGFMEDCGLVEKVRRSAVSENPVEDTSHPLYKKSIVMSGTRDKELEAALSRVGAVLGSSVSSKTFAVITPEIDGTTGKVATAKSLGLKVMTPEEFKRVYLGQ
jgi:NAD-dependent DNA ligase